MANEDEAYGGILQSINKVDILLTGDAEDILDAFVLQTFH